MAQIKITRTSGGPAVMRAIPVDVDGVTVARVRPGEQKLIEITEGGHQASAKIDWHRSHSVNFSTTQNSVITLEVDYTWDAFWKILSRKQGILGLRLVQ